MPSEHSPLLEGQPGLEIPRTRGFAKTTQRSSFVSGSVGRKGIADSLRPILISSSSYNNEDDSSIEDGPDTANPNTTVDVLTSDEALRLSREEIQLLEDNNIHYGSVSQAADTDNSTGADGSSSSNPNTVLPEVLLTAKAWDEAVMNGKLETTVSRELKTLVRSSIPLIVTFSLQYSLTVASIFSVGHLGKIELGAVSLASMTASITGYAMIQGMATCLDTLCAQAYGAGHYKRVGLYFQRCVAMCAVCFVPIGIFWLFSDKVMIYILPDKDLTLLAMTYLRIITFGAPGYILFECGKRFLQAQGIFHASTMVLLICAPINIVLNYVLVWNETIGLGFKGAAVAVATTDWLMAIMLFLYVVLVDGKKCWSPLSKKVFTGWSNMFRLAIPGVIMVEAEFLAFEILTFASSYFGTAELAAQSVLGTMTSLTYQIPFAVSIAASTRVANFIGATLGRPAKTAAYVALWCSTGVSLFNGTMLISARYKVGNLFSSDEDVLAIVAAVIPMCAILQLFDGVGAVAGGILRGQGRQKIGGYLNLFFYYACGIPMSLFLAFYCDWELYGLWFGVSFGLMCITIGQIIAIIYADWDSIIAQSQSLNREEIVISH